MGTLARSEIVARGLRLAGDTTLTTRANEWLNSWLRSQYAAWPWPFLIKRASSLTLAQGATSLTVGAGSGGVSDVIRQVRDPIFVYTTDKSMRVKARISQIADPSLAADESTILSTAIGVPPYFKVRAEGTTFGKWVLYPSLIPDRALLVAFDYLVQPADIDTSTGGDSTVPLYPDDETMIQAVFVAGLKYLKRYDELATEDATLSAMKSGDRLKWGEVLGTNGAMGLDPNVFL